MLENIRGKLYLNFNGDDELFYLGVIYKGVVVHDGGKQHQRGGLYVKEPSKGRREEEQNW